MSKYLRAIILWTFGTVNTICSATAIGVTVWVAKAFGHKDPSDAAHRIACVWGRNFFRVVPGWKVSIEGKQHLPSAGQACVFVANHQSMTDIFAMYCVETQFRWLSKEEVFKIPFVGFAMRNSGYIAVKRGNRESQKRAMETSADRLQNGKPMFFFPEGTRSETGELRPFKTGAFRLAAKNNVPIIPVCLQGTRDLVIKGSFLPSAAHVQIKILAPIYAEQDEDPQSFADRTREEVKLALQGETSLDNSQS